MTTMKERQSCTLGELQKIAHNLVGEYGVNPIAAEWAVANIHRNKATDACVAFLTEEAIDDLQKDNASPELVEAHKTLAKLGKEGKALAKKEYSQDLLEEFADLATRSNECRERIEKLSSVFGIVDAAVTTALLVEAPDVTKGDLVDYRQAVTVTKEFFPDSDGSLVLLQLTEGFKPPPEMLDKVAVAIVSPGSNGGVNLKVVHTLEVQTSPTKQYNQVYDWLTGSPGSNGVNSTSAFTKEVEQVIYD